MIRLTLLIAGGVFLGGIVHIATVILLPSLATRDAYSRLAQAVDINFVMPLSDAAAGPAITPFSDPSFATAICRYDLSQGPMKLSVPLGPAYTSISFYTRHGVAYYAINDQAARRRMIELELMTPEQHRQVPDEEDVTSADRPIVDSPTVTGLIAIRALAPEASLMEKAASAVAGAKCDKTR